MKILVTGDIGFIGYHLSKILLENNHDVIGIDNHNDYYDIKLKESRLKILNQFTNYQHYQCDINEINDLGLRDIEIIYNLAAQAGVRYSIDHPKSYVESNLNGFVELLEFAKRIKPKHFIFASSSSVYGLNQKSPFSVDDEVNHPANLYAATKRSNELIAHAYSYLYKIPITGIRFFTVYGPYGRPDMAYFLFTKNIIEGLPIEVFNNGDMYRDFTYVDDIVLGLYSILDVTPDKSNEISVSINLTPAPYRIYNMGNQNPVYLMDVIKEIEKITGKNAIIINKPMQLGDVFKTYADTKESTINFGYSTRTNFDEGIKKFVEWYMEYYK